MRGVPERIATHLFCSEVGSTASTLGPYRSYSYLRVSTGSSRPLRVDHHAVFAADFFGGDQSVEHVVEHTLRIARARIADWALPNVKARMFDSRLCPTSAALSREVRLRPALQAPHVSYRGHCCHDCDQAARQFMTHS